MTKFWHWFSHVMLVVNFVLALGWRFIEDDFGRAAWHMSLAIIFYGVAKDTK